MDWYIVIGLASLVANAIMLMISPFLWREAKRKLKEREPKCEINKNHPMIQ